MDSWISIAAPSKSLTLLRILRRLLASHYSSSRSGGTCVCSNLTPARARQLTQTSLSPSSMTSKAMPARLLRFGPKALLPVFQGPELIAVSQSRQSHRESKNSRRHTTSPCPSLKDSTMIGQRALENRFRITMRRSRT